MYLFHDIKGVGNTFSNILWRVKLAFALVLSSDASNGWTRGYHVIGRFSSDLCDGKIKTDAIIIWWFVDLAFSGRVGGGVPYL